MQGVMYDSRPQSGRRGARFGGAAGVMGQPTVTAILDRLDAADDSRFRNRRGQGGARLRFRRTDVEIHVRHPGGSISDGTIVTRNLSNSGIGFLYNSFLHVGTEVSIILPRKLGGEDEIEGEVVYCQHIVGKRHQVGVKFAQKIFAKLYLPDDVDDAARAAAAALAAPFAGSLLLIDGQPMDRALVTHHMRNTAARVSAAESVDAAIAIIRAPGMRFDAVICEIDVNVPGRGIAATVSGIRSAGHQGAIIVATATKADAMVTRAIREAGATAVITKPYERAELLGVLSQTASATVVDTVVKKVEQTIDDIYGILGTCAAAAKR